MVILKVFSNFLLTRDTIHTIPPALLEGNGYLSFGLKIMRHARNIRKRLEHENLFDEAFRGGEEMAVDRR